ncbi:MAG: hypothetical protein EAX95_12115 [Candidatus Thorarchaeota archaeon]|nr:hypothetical protein [Candidatus Thorarchaeota archaeon]
MPRYRARGVILISLVMILSAPLIAAGFHITKTSANDSFTTSGSAYDVTITVASVYIIEDRDYLDAEIFLKARIDSGSTMRSSTYTGINDGDTIQLDWMIFNGQRSSFTVRVEVWEEDELANDYLGYVEYTRNPPINADSEYNTVGSIGGGNDPQARVRIIETAYLDPHPQLFEPPDKTFSEGTTGHYIRWIAFDDNPDTYIITRDMQLVDSGNWTSEVPIDCSLDGLLEGEYDFSIFVNDTEGLWAEDSVHVTVTEAVTTTTSTETATDGWLSELSPQVVGSLVIVAGAAIMLVYFLVRKTADTDRPWPTDRPYQYILDH